MVASPTFVNEPKQMTLALTPRMVLSPDDFSPPLKRTEAAVPGYWTVDELKDELDVSRRYIHYCIKGDTRKKNPIYLKNYKVGSVLLVPDSEALPFLWKMKQSSFNS
jgi:hypothetical protein